MNQLKQTRVLVPWFDTDGNKNWMNFLFVGDVDKRRAYREIYKTVKKTLQRSVSKEWIRVHCLFQAPEDEAKQIKEALDNFIEHWIDRLECKDATSEDGATSGDTGGTPSETEQPMQDMQDSVESQLAR